LLGKVVAFDRFSIGENAFVMHFDKITSEDALKIKNAINFYEQQVLRQALETDKKNINLFKLNKKAKDEIVKSELKEIVEYIIDNAYVCVFGELTSSQKKRMLTALSNPWNSENKIIINNIIDMISNYTTLKELKTGVIKQKTLDRFIIK